MADTKDKDRERKELDSSIAQGLLKLQDIFFLANLYIDQKRFKEAIELYEFASHMFPDNLSIRINLGKVLELKDQHETTLMQEIDDKISQRRKTDDLFANHYYGLGVRYLRKKNYPKAMEYFHLAIYKNPVFSSPYLRLGEIYYQQKKYDESQNSLHMAMKLNKFDERIYALLGAVYMQKGAYVKALESFVDAAILSGKLIKDTPYRSSIKKAFKRGNFESKETISRYFAMRNEKFNKLVEALEQRRTEDQKGFEEHLRSLRQEEIKTITSDKKLLHKKLHRLAKYEIFSKFTDAEIMHLLSMTQEERFPEGHLIFTEAQLGNQIYIIETGQVKTYRNTPVGEVVLKMYGPGEFFGEIGLIDNLNRSTNAAAVKLTSVLTINKNNLNLMFESQREMAVKMYFIFWKSLSNNLRASNAIVNRFLNSFTDSPTSSIQPKPQEKVEPIRKLSQAKISLEKKMTALANKGLSPEDLNLIATVSEEEFYHADEIIFREGEPGSKLYIILSGKVRISKSTSGGGEEAIAILGKGDFFGEMAIIDNSPRSADAKAHEDFTIVLTIDKKDLDNVLSAELDRAYEFLKILCRILSKRLREINDLICNWYIMSRQFG